MAGPKPLRVGGAAHGPTRVIGYRRVSTDGQAENGYGLAVQADVLQAFCRRERLRLVKTFTDPGVPGSTPLEEREGLAAALAAVRAGEGEALVVARYDRLARETLQALLIEEAFRAVGAGILYAEGVNGDGDGMEFLRTILHAASQEQKRQLVHRLAAARRAKAAAGGYAGGRPPFGYRGGEGFLRPDEAESEVVRWIFQQAADEGHSVRKIAVALDREGTLERRWRASTVQRILSNATYKSGPSGSRIVDPRIWNRAHAALAKRRRS
jgi:DNA invertase Pin-like site-specific DNA recombinase